MNLSKIFSSPNKWTQNCCARDKDGRTVSMTAPQRSEREWINAVNSLSLYGAIVVFTEQDSSTRSRTMDRLSKAIERYTGKRLHVAAFNDNPDTKFEDIVKVLEIFNKISKEQEER